MLAAIVVIITSAIRLIFELYQVFQMGPLKYFLDWINWVEVILFTFSIVFVVVFFTDCFCPRYADRVFVG